MTDSIWPERPFACAGAEWVLAPQRLDETCGVHLELRMCSSCSSIHPEDLYDRLWLNEPLERPEFTGVSADPGEAFQAISAYRQQLVSMPLHMTGTPWTGEWPHKFHIRNVPNLAAGSTWIRRDHGPTPPIGSAAVFDGDTGMYHWTIKSECPPVVSLVWYSAHLLDLEPEALDLLAEQLERHTDIRWVRQDEGLSWEAPHYNYYR